MLKKIFGAAVLAMLAGPSLAAGGAYVGVDVGETTIDTLSGHKASFGGFAGWAFNPTFSLEAAYRRLGKWDYFGTDVTVNQTSLSVIGNYVLNPQYDVFARLGYNRLNAEADGPYGGSGCTKGAMYGFGVAYNIEPNVSARLEWQKPSSDSSNLSLGVLFRF